MEPIQAITVSSKLYYFLHNEVNTIQHMYEKLSNLLPEARIQIAHGQMRERELEHVMRDFYQQRFIKYRKDQGFALAS